jgi:precorrin-4/cobalt-precorrin-4 C11-methyltransferase
MIHIVGAGSGAVDLITLRGARFLEEADVVIYAGSLVNPDLLKMCKPGAVIHDSASMTLDQVIRVVQDAHAKGLDVVRLHTGDPSIYGAIKEQMERFDELSIPYDMTPGVSSMGAAAAALKAEYTLPDVSQTVIVTRMAGRTPVPAAEEMSSLARHRATMVIFLSASLLEELTESLIAGGYPPETPAAIVYKASWPDEAVYRCDVADIARTARENSIGRTALIVVGDVLSGVRSASLLYDASFSHGYREASVLEGSDEDN